MANNCDTHLLSVPNGHLCPKCLPGQKKTKWHLKMIEEKIKYALEDEVPKNDILTLVKSLCK